LQPALTVISVEDWPELENELVRLRVRDLGDVAAQLAGEDDEISRWLFGGGRSTEQSVRNHIIKCREMSASSDRQRAFGIRDRATDSLAGTIEINGDDPDLCEGEVNVSYMVFPAWRRRGFASASLDLVVAFVTEQDLANAVILKIDPDNAASLAVAARAGFVPDGSVFAGGAQLVRLSLAIWRP
jgi:RimJ/RimL family protein N-acetyltransferase